MSNVLITIDAGILPIAGARFDGTQWHDDGFTATPLRTRKGTVSVYGEDFKGVLIEPPRTNLFLTSNNIMDTTAWTTPGVSKEIESTVKYKGNNTNKITVTSTNSTHYFYASSTLIALGTVYTFHAFFKKGEGNFIQIMFGSSRFELDAYANVDLSDGSFGSIGASITSSIITDMGDGWYLVEVTSVAKSSGTSTSIAVAAVPAKDAARLPSFLGAGEVFYYYNLQFEVGSFATSPIVTAATTVTRPAANLTRPTAGTALAALNNWGVRLRFRPTAAGQTAVLWGSYTDANNSTRIDLAASTLTYTKRLAGSNHVAQASLTHAAAILYDVIIYQHSASGMGVAFRSWNGSAWSAWSAWATLTDANGIANAAIASTYQIGALNNASHVSANMPFCHVFQLKSALAAQSEIADLLAKGRI